ncbi:hypothetical protein MCOR34_008448 [Pyricularia oryzae]|uniref:CHAT domain-containing protein n=1 Tax=Pyricularia oryzae TaxID=318829 RepID=A0A4P7NL98_PYROR|nr:hypothetical protein MCOR34_008448 [Pyricularia oryzae]QBZ62917.1 hypothetical protein PoMZ_11806 [Pyricularia oryzae]
MQGIGSFRNTDWDVLAIGIELLRCRRLSTTCKQEESWLRVSLLNGLIHYDKAAFGRYGLPTKDPYENSETRFSFGVVDEDNKEQSDDNDLWEFQKNRRASTAIRCYTNDWNLGILAEDDESSHEMHGCAMTDLDEAIALSDEAVKDIPESHPSRFTLLNNLGGQLGQRFSRAGAMEDSEKGIAIARKIVKTMPETHPDRALQLSNLAVQLNLRSQQGDRDAGANMENIKEAISRVREAVKATGSNHLAKPLRLNALGVALGERYQHTGDIRDLEEAIAVTKEAREATPQDHPNRPALLINLDTLAALQMLETGRGVLTGSLYNIRTDMSGLEERHPDLERDFRFLLSATEDEMREAAVCSPIVVINVSSHRCDALIVEHSGLRVVGLAQLTPASLEEHAGDLGGAETLAWLWDVIVKPVLDALGITAPPAGNVWQHIWWIPTGILTRFPLHAAGHHHKHNAETTMGMVVSSYSPSIRSIIHTRRKQGSEKDADLGLNVVLVDMRETPGHTPLLYATVETKAVEQVCKSIGLRCDRPLACKEDILAALESCEVLHFAGHGGTCPDPLRSFLLLKDWENSPLTVESLFERNLSARSRFLAYLSACGTGPIQDSSSVDESIHLTTASVKGDYETAVDHVLKFLVEVGEVVLPVGLLVFQYWKTENGPHSSLKNCYGFGGMSPHSNPGNG